MVRTYSFDCGDLVFYFILLSFVDFILKKMGIDYWPLIAAFGFSFSKKIIS
mgnify:CR=1 FL=1